MRKPKGKFKSESLRKRMRIKLTTRKKVIGSSERPRLCAMKTNKHLGAQLIDDSTNKTLFAVQTYGKNAGLGVKKGKEGAKVIGEKIAEKLKEQGISSVVFDRNGKRYTGLIAIMADAIREAGIKL